MKPSKNNNLWTLSQPLLVALSLVAIVSGCTEKPNSFTGTLKTEAKEESLKKAESDLSQNDQSESDKYTWDRYRKNRGSRLLIDVRNLQPLVGQHYEGWAIVNGAPISTGRFNIDSDGRILSVNARGRVLRRLTNSNRGVFHQKSKIDQAATFVLTIEPNGDSEAGPSSIHIAGGDFSNGHTSATVGHGAAIGTDFSNASGSYFLATPTNGADTNNQGIWYLEMVNGAPQASLNLPDLTDKGFVYEGWVVNLDLGQAHSTGRFSTESQADSDGAGYSSGPKPFPPFPGQDFIRPALDLTAGNIAAVITVEPEVDYDPAPFSMKLLRSRISGNADLTTSLPLDLHNVEGFPAINVTIF